MTTHEHHPSPPNIGPKLTALANFLAFHGDFLPSVSACVSPGGEIRLQPWGHDDPTAVHDWAAALGATVATTAPVMSVGFVKNYAYRSSSFRTTLPGTDINVHMFDHHQHLTPSEYHTWQVERAQTLDEAAARAVNSNRNTTPFGTLPARVTDVA